MESGISQEGSITEETHEGVRQRKILSGSPEFLKIKYGERILEEAKDHPLYLMMNLETTCNTFRCGKCACPGRNRKLGEPLTLEERKQIFDLFSAAGANELVIVGAGEPSESENFAPIVKPTLEAAKESGLGSIVFTTGVGLTIEQDKFFRDNNTTIIISLDSLDPEVYRTIMGNKNVDIEWIKNNINMLREVYGETQEILEDGSKIVRIGINTTVMLPNESELDNIKKFAGKDMMYVANPAIPSGKFANYRGNWDRLAGEGEEGRKNWERHRNLAKEKSETEGHSSLTEGVCGYGYFGMAIDVDGAEMICGYQGDSAHFLGNIKELLKLPKEEAADKLKRNYRAQHWAYRTTAADMKRRPSCPMRDPEFNAAFHKNLQEVLWMIENGLELGEISDDDILEDPLFDNEKE